MRRAGSKVVAQAHRCVEPGARVVRNQRVAREPAADLSVKDPAELPWKALGVDVVFEHVGKDTFAASMFCLKRGGRLVTCGSTSGVSTEVNLMMLFQQQFRIIGSFGCRMENMANAMQKMARGLVHPVIDTQVSFDDIDKALARMEGRQVFGKIILKMD